MPTNEDEHKPNPHSRSQSKTEADEVTGPTPNPGNESDLSDLVEHRPQRAEKLSHRDKGRVVGAEVTEKADGEKIGRIPGQHPKVKAKVHWKYQVVVLTIGPDGDIAPGPDTAAIHACIAAGYRPVGEASIEKVEDHPDGVSKAVTWDVPAVEATDPEWKHEEAATDAGGGK